jgi:hypothetical protein
MNPQAIRDYSPLLADAVTAALDAGEFPVVLGGDCSILLGTMLALRRRGRYGLLYIDGDADFYQPEVNPLNGAASASDLAFATGSALTSSPTSKAGGRWYGLRMWRCSPAVTLLTGNAGAASHSRQACWSLTVTRSASSAPARLPARRLGT